MKFIDETVGYAEAKNFSNGTTAAMLNHLKVIRDIYVENTSSAAGIEAAAP